MPDPLIIERAAVYENVMEGRYWLYLKNIFFPEVDGSRQPIFTELLDDREEYLKLRETARAALLVGAGQLEANFETTAYLENRDGAQERLVALQRQFEEQT